MRLKRMYYQNAVYHVFFRGNNRQNVLGNAEGKRDLLLSIGKFQERKGFKIYAFVLMDNHAHLVVEVNEKFNISNVMHAILLSFSVKYRRKNDYHGYVWQGRFESKPIEGEGYMNQCIEYVHLNPVKAEIVLKSTEYIYSSARFYEGQLNKTVAGLIEITRYGDSSVITSTNS